MIKEDLKTLGLSENEAAVYLAVLKKGAVKAGEIIRETGMHRNLAYQALEKLASRRLVSKSERGGVAHFQVTDVSHLLDDVREKELVATRLIGSLKERARLGDQEIVVYEGEESIRVFSAKLVSGLADGSKVHMLGAVGVRFAPSLGAGELAKYLRAIRAKSGTLRVLASRQDASDDASLRAIKAAGAEVRTLPFEVSPDAVTVFTDEIVAFQIFGRPQTVIEIRNAHLATAYRNYFDLLWKQNVRVEQGMDALHRAFYGMIDELRPGEAYRVLGGNFGRAYEKLSGFFAGVHAYRVGRGVAAHILAQNDAAPLIRELTRIPDPDDEYSDVRTFQTPFLSPMQINLYRGKAVMILYKDEPTVLHFEDAEVHDGFSLYFEEIWNRQTSVLRGREGAIAMCEQVLEEGQDLYHIAANGSFIKRYAEYYRGFTERRVKQGLRLRMLAIGATRGGPLPKLPLSETRFLPDEFASPMVIWIFGDYVAHVLWHEPETIFMIKDAKTADYYRQYYEAMKQLTRP